MRVKKRNGRLEDFNAEKVNKNVERACQGMNNVSAAEIIVDAQLQLYDKIPTAEIDKALILTARSKIYKDPEYSKVAARLLLNCIYKEVFKESVDCDTFESDYKSAFIKNVKKQVKEGRLDERNLDLDLKKISEAIDVSRDDIFSYVALQNIYDRYLLRKNDGKIFETPQAYYMRIAMGLSYNEENPEDFAIQVYDFLSTHRFSPSTPTLFNSATRHNQLSSCYLSEIDDSVDGIFDGLWQEARKSKYAGGLGFHVSRIRAMGAHIKGTNGRSSGLVPWLKVYNDMLIACDQAGKRQGSGCAYLEPWHLDVQDFIDLRKETGEERRRCHDLNTALWCPDIFFRRIEEDGEWTLFCPSIAPELPDLYGEEFDKRYEELEEMARNGELKKENFRVLRAKDLWKEVLRSLFETSHPWITHKDNANMRYSNIHEGTLHGSNLCCEIFLHTKHSKYKDGEKIEIGETAVCNLASIVLPNHVDLAKKEIVWDDLAKTVEIAIRALNNVIDINFYPTKEAEKANMSHRPIGLGNMGFADLCYMLDVVQDSDEGVDLADKVAEFISYHAILTSSKLAKERGPYSTYEGSKWSQNVFPIDTYNQLMSWKDSSHVAHEETLDWTPVRDHVAQYGMRNSNTMAIAPNASIAYQMGCTQSIEPDFKVLFVYENKSGNYYLLNEHFVRDMKAEGLWGTEFCEMLKQVDGYIDDLDIPEKYKEKYRVAFERDQFKLIEANGARQKWIDMGISFNTYNDKTSLKWMNDIYVHSNKCGLKSNYYLRSKAASQVAKVTTKKVEVATEVEPEVEEQNDEQSAALSCSLEAMRNGGTCEMCEG
jgi:ribonucleoside-diphosphate reductase alpha chain